VGLQLVFDVTTPNLVQDAAQSLSQQPKLGVDDLQRNEVPRPRFAADCSDHRRDTGGSAATTVL